MAPGEAVRRHGEFIIRVTGLSSSMFVLFKEPDTLEIVLN